MDLKDTGQDTVDLEFEIPEAGVSVFQFEEGITKRTNENSGKTTLQLPMIIDQVLEGPESNEGKKLSHFVPIETEFGERQLAGILTLTGLISSFAGKFGAKVDITEDEKFINALKLKLVGKFVKGHHTVRKDQAGKDRANVTKFERFVKGKSKPRPSEKSSNDDSAGDDDWD